MQLPTNISQRIGTWPTQSGNRDLVKYQIRNPELAKQYWQQVQPTSRPADQPKITRRVVQN